MEPSPVAEQRVELDDGLLLLQAELAPLDVRPEVVRPPEAAALAAPLQPCATGHHSHTHVSFSYEGARPGSVAEQRWTAQGLRLRTSTRLAIELAHRLWRAASASSHGRAAQCRRAASGPPPASTAPSSTRPSRSTAIAPSPARRAPPRSNTAQPLAA